MFRQLLSNDSFLEEDPRPRRFVAPTMNSSTLIFRQLFESVSSTYTYIIACPKTKIAAIIDPVLETAQRDADLIKELGLDLRFGLNTHVHADHITGTDALSKIFPKMKAGLSDAAGDAKADLFFKHGEKIAVGNLVVEVRHTPGHTDGCVTYILESEGMLFSGDALFHRGCGRTDFQQGCPERLFDSVWNNILNMPEDTIIFPGHDYKGHMATSVGEEKKFNPRLTLSKEKFVEFMNNLKLDYPKQIDRALPANLRNGEVMG